MHLADFTRRGATATASLPPPHQPRTGSDRLARAAPSAEASLLARACGPHLTGARAEAGCQAL
eukprot:14734981-Alexandrium_andersonii.AAC.1